jgi:hypothetical protein
MAPDDYNGPERRRRGSDEFDRYKVFILDKIKNHDDRLGDIDRDLAQIRIKQVSFGILGAIAGALPGLITALFMYYSLVHKVAGP